MKTGMVILFKTMNYLDKMHSMQVFQSCCFQKKAGKIILLAPLVTAKFSIMFVGNEEVVCVS